MTNNIVCSLNLCHQHLIGENKSVSSINYNQEIGILAVARKRTIELWNCNHFPQKECQFIDIPSDSLEAVVWCNNTLYSAGLNGHLYQYSMENLDISHKIPIMGGPTWCLASSENGNYIAAGTETGSVCIYEVNSGYVTFKTFFKQNNRILSVAWHPNNEILVAGSMNELYVINIITGKTNTITIQRNCSNQDVSVHAIEILMDMTIITGDSRGYVCFLDGTLGTYITEVKSHKAPVLCLQKSEDSQVIYATGNDSSIVDFHLFSSKKNGTSKWINNAMGRCGEHSLHSLSYDNKSNSLFAAGEDAYLYRIVATPLGKLHINSFPITPPMGYVSVSKHAQCLLLGTSRKITMFKVHPLSAIDDGSVKAHSRKLIKIQLKESSILRWLAISKCATNVAYIDTTGLHIYRAHYETSATYPTMLKIELSEDVKDCRQVQFLDKSRLITAKNNVIQVLKIKEDIASVERTTEVVDGIVRLIAVSGDGKYFALTTSLADIYVFSKNLEFYKLPNKGVLPTAIAFDAKNQTICVTYSNCSFVEFDMIHKKYTKFYSQFKDSDAESTIGNLKLPILSVSYDSEDCIIFNTISNLIKISKLEYNECPNSNTSELECRPAKKTKFNLPSTESVLGKVKIVNRDGHLLVYTYFGNSEAVTLEVSKEFIDKTAPKGMKRKIFSVGLV